MKMKNKDFRAVYAAKHSTADSILILYKLNTDNGYIRVGYSVSKKVGNSVIRHKMTRRLREICRARLSNSDGSFDLVIIAKPKAANCSFDLLDSSLAVLLKRIDRY